MTYRQLKAKYERRERWGDRCYAAMVAAVIGLCVLMLALS